MIQTGYTRRQPTSYIRQVNNTQNEVFSTDYGSNS